MTGRRWDDDRGAGDAPHWMNDEQATAWALGWNACVRECVDQTNAVLARETVGPVSRSFWQSPSGRLHSLPSCSGAGPRNRMRRVSVTYGEFLSAVRCRCTNTSSWSKPPRVKP